MLTQETAEILGINALGWLAGHDELFPIFQGATGADVAAIRDGAVSKETLIAVLDFILMDDDWIKEFCDAHNHDYLHPLMAREILGGGDNPHWT